MKPSIAIIHATRAAVTPIEETFARLWPDAEITSLLDESLSRDLDREGELTPALSERIGRLACFAKNGGADAILFSCSAFGGAIETTRASMDIPVLKPNEAMFEEALAAGSHICLVTTFKPSVKSMLKELDEMSGMRGQKIETDSWCVPGALEALLSGDGEKHDNLIAEAVSKCPPCDVVLLGQFSMARALPAVARKIGTKILTSPASAVSNLREQLSTVKVSV